MQKCTHFTYLLNIDIDIAIFCKYRIDIVSKLKTDIEAALSQTCQSVLETSGNIGIRQLSVDRIIP